MRIDEIEGVEPGQKVDITTEQEEKYIELIQTHCSESLHAIQQVGFLYRGLGNWDLDKTFPLAFKGQSRNDRKSLSGVHEDQLNFDTAMQYYGFTALRNNSIFTSGDKYQARVYGAPYLIFPVNGFNILWSPKLRDFLATSSMVSQQCRDALNSKDQMGAIQQVVRFWDIKDSNLADAIQSKSEILINGKYLAFLESSFRELFQAVFKIPKNPGMGAV